MVMSSTSMIAAAGAILALVATPALPVSAPRDAGTIAVRSPHGTENDDPLAQVSTDAATTALGMKGFTILDDPNHAAYIAEVSTKRTEVGTSVMKGPTERPLATGAGVNI